MVGELISIAFFIGIPLAYGYSDAGAVGTAIETTLRSARPDPASRSILAKGRGWIGG